MYALIVDKLRVGPEHLAVDNIDELLTELVAPQYLDLAKQILDNVNSTIVEPILKCENNDIIPTFQNSLVPFTISLAGLNTIIFISQGNNLSRLVSLDQTFYSKILTVVKEKILPLSVESGMKLLDVLERLIDYDNVVLGVLIKRPEQLIEALKEVDVGELLTSISGTVLALATTIVLLKDKQLNLAKIAILLDISERYSDIIESYADTIDILSNKEEMELLKRSEQE